MIALTLATILSGAFAIVVRFGQRRDGDLLAIGMVNYVVASLAFLPSFQVLGAAVSRQTVVAGAAGGLVYATAYYLLLPVLRSKGVAISTAVMRLSVILPMLLSLLLWQEVPTTLQGGGAALAFAALPMLAIGQARGATAQAGRQPLIPVAALFVLNGACLCVQKLYQAMGTFAERPAFFMALFGVAAIYTGTVWFLRSRRLTATDLGIGALLGLVNASANFATLAALDAYSGVVVFPVTAAGGLVFVALFAALFWREVPSRWGMAGILLAVGAVALVGVASGLEAPAYRPALVLDGTDASPFGVPDQANRLPSERARTDALQEEAMDELAAGHDLAGLWELTAIMGEPLDVRVLRKRGAGWGAGRVEHREVVYHSHDWAEGEVLIHAYISLPAADDPVPAVIMGTGDADSGEEFCRKHRVATIVIERPGTGDSSGPEDDYTNWVRFDDPRESWMWHYINAALRAVTLATTLSEVDPDRIGITGSSRGGTMAWIANGVDPRLKLSIPVATGGDIVRALDHGGWANYIHRDEQGQPYLPGEFHNFARFYDPLHYCGNQHGGVMLIVGAQDEYFPLYCTATTAQAAADDDFRMLIIANWDHGYFTADNAHVDAWDNRQEASRKTDHAVAAAIDCWLRGARAMPSSPELVAEREADRLVFSLTASEAGTVERALLHVSLDGAYTFEAFPLTREGGRFTAELTGLDSAVLDGVAAYAEVEYTGGGVVTSIPWFGRAFRQVMRPFPEPDDS